MSSPPRDSGKESGSERLAGVAPVTERTDHLRVLIANERKDRLLLVAPIVVALGHEVIASAKPPAPSSLCCTPPTPRSSERRPSEVCLLTSQMTTSRTGRARSTSSYAASLNFTTFKARSGVALDRAGQGHLMERHSIDEEGAFEMLRDRSRSDNRKVVDLAGAVVDGHRLLPKAPQGTPEP